MNPLAVGSMVRDKIKTEIFRRTKQNYDSAIKALEVDSSGPPPGAVKAGLRRYAIKHAQKELLDLWIGFPVVLLWGLYLLLCGLFACRDLASTENVPHWYTNILGGFIFAGIIKIFYLRVPSKIKRFVDWLLIAGLVTWALQFRTLTPKRPWYIVANGIPTESHEKLVAYVLLTVAIFLACASLFGLGIDVVYALTVTRHYKRHPESLLLFVLLWTRLRLRSRQIRMRNPAFKAAVANDFESAASLLENGLPRSLRLQNDAIKKQLYTSFAAAAAALREMEIRIIVSDDSTLSKLRSEITDIIYAIAAGDYALLPTAEPIASRSRGKRIASIVRDVVVAFIPLAAIITLQYLGVKAPAEISGSATLVGLTWAIVSITTIFDPKYKSKISDVGEMISMIRNGKG